MHVSIEKPSDAHNVIKEARNLAFELGFSDFNIGMITIAVAEITTNVVRYALPGIAKITKLKLNKGIEIVIEDQGPGIDDFDKAMVDGFSTYCEPSLGRGLGSAKRCIEEFILTKNNSTGVSIILRHYLPLLDKKIEKSSISLPAIGQNDNGDRHLFKPYQGDKLFVCLIDGAGKGDNAAYSSKYALEIVEEHYKNDFITIIKLCHSMIKKNRPYHPVQMGLLRITPDSLEFCAIGDVGIKIVADTKISFTVNDGSIGLILPSKIHTNRIKRPKNMTLLLHSDGVVLPEAPNLDCLTSLDRDICSLYNQTALANDDATLIAIRDRDKL